MEAGMPPSVSMILAISWRYQLPMPIDNVNLIEARLSPCLLTLDILMVSVGPYVVQIWHGTSCWLALSKSIISLGSL